MSKRDLRKRDAAPAEYVLLLYVTGMTERSLRAVENVRSVCRQHLEGRYDLRVIDLYQEPALARGDQIFAAPTLIKKLPAPLRRLIGDLSQRERVIEGLDIQPKKWKFRKK